MTTSPGRAQLLASVTEEQFLQQVLTWLKRAGFKTYNTRDSRRSTAGFPDIIAVRGDRILAIELKSATGRVTPAQYEWLLALKLADVETYIWQPTDEKVVRAVLE